MAYDEHLSQRIADILDRDGVRFKEKKMFGGVAFMVKSKMCLGVNKLDVMVRFDPGIHEKTLLRKGAREMDFTHRPMRGFVFVSPEGTRTDSQLRSWVDLALAYNPEAKKSRARKKSK